MVNGSWSGSLSLVPLNRVNTSFLYGHFLRCLDREANLVGRQCTTVMVISPSLPRPIVSKRFRVSTSNGDSFHFNCLASLRHRKREPFLVMPSV